MATQPNYKGALTQYMTHPEEWTYHIPGGMTTMEGALVEPAAVGMHAAVLGGAQPGKSIVILGGGTDRSDGSSGLYQPRGNRYYSCRCY